MTYRYIPTIEWIIIYSHVPLTFHIITNTDSKPYVEKVTAKNGSKCPSRCRIVMISLRYSPKSTRG